MSTLNAAMDCDAFRNAVDAPADGNCRGCNGGLTRATVVSGPNAGRVYIRCPNSQQGVRNACAAEFRFVDVRPGEFVSNVHPLLRCKTCQRQLESGRVNKEGPNKGQIFWSCKAGCANSFVWDAPNTIVKEPKVGKAEFEKLQNKVTELEARVFYMGNQYAQLAAFVKMPLVNVQAPHPF